MWAVTPMLGRVEVTMVVVMEGTTCKDMVLMEVIVGTWLLGGLFSVIIARCQAIPYKNATKYMVTHLVTHCTKARGLQLLSLKNRMMFLG